MDVYYLPVMYMVCILLILPLDAGIIPVEVRETLTADVSGDVNNVDVESTFELSRQRRATNDSSVNDTTTTVATPSGGGGGNTGNGGGKSAVEEFFDDRHNMAMYVILPSIILVYGGCSCIYCFYKCRRYLRKRVVIYQKQRRDRVNSGHKPKWTAANNKVQIVKSTPNLRENISNPNPRPATSMALFTSIETQEVDMLLEELAVITDDKPVKKASKPVAEVTPVVQVKTTPVKSPIKEKVAHPPLPLVEDKREETPIKREQSRSPVVEVKPVSQEDDNKKENLNKKKSLILSANDIAEIMKYYNDKKHMPNVIPEDSENDKQISRKIRKKKIISS
ncbi:uncharacterized protein [Argopecten irradians]|uniref:uncharacterized protein n=1 Tax=Argopecten irradians TaxID=31199 RepID=UPI0037205200